MKQSTTLAQNGQENRDGHSRPGHQPLKDLSCWTAWIPLWLYAELKEPSYVRVMAYILWWFDSAKNHRCRAHGAASNGQRVLRQSLAQIGRETGLHPNVVKRALRFLSKQDGNKRFSNWIFGLKPKGRSQCEIFPGARRLGIAYRNFTGSKIAKEELKAEEGPLSRTGYTTEVNSQGDSDEASVRLTGWYESKTRQQAMRRFKQAAIIVRPEDFADANNKPGPSMLLAVIRYRLRHGGELGLSCRAFERKYCFPRRNTSLWLSQLEDWGLINVQRGEGKLDLVRVTLP